MSNCSRRERGDKREEDQYPTANYHATITSISANIYPNQYNKHWPTSSFTLLHIPSTPFPNSNATSPSSSTLQNSSNYSLVPTILHTSSNSTNLYKPHPFLLSYHKFTPLITNHSTLFLSSNNPAETDLSLNN